METAAFVPILLESFRRQLRESGIEPAEPSHVNRHRRTGLIAAMLERWRARQRPAMHPAPATRAEPIRA